MSVDTQVRRKIAQWVDLENGASDETIRVASELLRRLVEQEALFRGYAPDPEHPLQVSVNNTHADFFTTNRSMIIAQMRVFLTETQDLEWRIRENDLQIRRLLVEQANPIYLYLDDIERYETLGEAKSRINSEINNLTLQNQFMRERLEELQ